MLVKESVYSCFENIFNYSIENKKRNKDASVELQAIIIAFFNALLEKIKDINSLYQNNRKESIELISRTYFEQYVYAMYILKSDSERKSKAFIYGFWISELRKYKKTVDKMEINERYHHPSMSFEEFKNQVDILSTLEVPGVNNYDELIEYYENEYRNLLLNKDWKPNFKNLKWYNLTGRINSMRGLLKEIDLKDSEYELAYALPSTPLHGTDIVRKISVDRESSKIIYKRNHNNLDSIKSLLVLCLKNLTLEIAKFYGVEKSNKVRGEMTRMRINYKGYP